MISFFKKYKKKTNSFEEEQSIYHKIENLSIVESWHMIINKYGISLDGKDLYIIGQKYINKDIANEYVTSVIIPIFDNIEKEISLFLIEKENKVNNIIEEIKLEITSLEADLGNYISSIDVKIQEAQLEKNNTDELTKGVFFEEKLKKIIDGLFLEYEKSVAYIKTSQDDNLTTLDKINEYKLLINLSKKQLFTFKEIYKLFSEKLHSFHYPPKKRYIYMFFSFCILLLFGEVGFSIKIITSIIDLKAFFPNDYRFYNIFSSIVFSVAMSISFAIILYYLIDYLLFKKGFWPKFGFWFIFIFITFLILNFYSYKPTEAVSLFQFNPTVKSAMISFFSVSFAFSNALVFREAIYLHHLYFRMNSKKYKSNKLDLLYSEKEKFIFDRNNYLINKKKQLSTGQSHLNILNHKISNDLNEMLVNLKTININMFWQGFNTSIDIIIEESKDFDLVLKDIYKKKLQI